MAMWAFLRFRRPSVGVAGTLAHRCFFFGLTEHFRRGKRAATWQLGPVQRGVSP